MLPGITTFLAVGILFGIAYRRYSLNNSDPLILVCLLLAGLALRLYVGADLYLHSWDERYHALVAKHLLDHPFQPMLYDNPVLPYDYRGWASNHIWLHKQPLPLWLLAGSMQVFGVHEWAVRVPGILLTAVGIWLMFRIGQLLFNRKAGYLSAALYAIHGLIIELAGGRVATDHVDVCFLFFVQLGVYWSLLEVKTGSWVYTVVAGLAIGCAILVKWLPALIVGLVWGVLALGRKTYSWKTVLLRGGLMGLVAFLVAAPWQWYMQAQFPLESAWEKAYNVRHLYEDIEGHGRSFWYHFRKIGRVFSEVIYLPLIWGLSRIRWRRLNYRELALLVWILVPLIFFSLATTKLQAYTLMSAPAFFLMHALFFQHLRQWTESTAWQKGLCWLVLAALIVLPVRYSLERTKVFTPVDRYPAWQQSIDEFGRHVQRQHPQDSVLLVGTDHPIETMFHIDRVVAYEQVPEEAVLDSLRAVGYVVYREQRGKMELVKDD